MIDGLLQAQECAGRFATTREQYVRMVENSILADLEADLAGAPDLAMKLAFVEAAAERLGAMA